LEVRFLRRADIVPAAFGEQSGGGAVAAVSFLLLFVFFDFLDFSDLEHVLFLPLTHLRAY
jgi:hypothetical protein